jgi:hypothetical protein
MQFYWYILLVIIFFNVVFSLVSVNKFAHSIAQGNFDIYSIMFTSFFIMLLGFIFQYMLVHAEKAY